MLAKQNKLLHTCLYILLCLGEDVNIEKKMVNRQLCSLLCGVLDREMDELVFVALTFIKKLSIFEDNKDVLAQNLPKLVGCICFCSHSDFEPHGMQMGLITLNTQHTDIGFPLKLPGRPDPTFPTSTRFIISPRPSQSFLR